MPSLPWQPESDGNFRDPDADKPRLPIILDSDIGSYPDDAFALALAVASPELEIVGVTTCGEQAEDRAWLTCRFLTQVGVKDLAVAWGADSQPAGKMDEQIQYRRHPAAIFNRTLKPGKERAADWMAKAIAARPGQITLICLGPLTNAARLLRDHPEAAKKLKGIVVSGGSIMTDYEGKKNTTAEWNIKSDIPAAKAVFASGLPLTVVPLDATVPLTLNRQQCDALFSTRNMLTLQVQNLFELSGAEFPAKVFDVGAIAALTVPECFQWIDAVVDVDDNGKTLIAKGQPNARVARGSDAIALVKATIERLQNWGKESPPREERNPSKLIDRGAFPVRVHAFEDYETDIERRWWMSGLVQPGEKGTGHRICRDMLTQDFDDRQGDLKTMYRAVIFNPVPGPPMGPRTRLSFRYKLQGTSTLRVQLYSLTNGYHRYLSLHGLEQGKWLDGCVDMTDMRKPDGTGGPLTKDERIDDIQFYVPANAHVWIDEMTLYEAAVEGEKRPFPKRLVFTAWFDTGKQGKEWPGDFEIVAQEPPRTWKAAKSIPDNKGKPVLCVDLRGERKLDATAELTFLYRTRGDKPVEVELVSRAGKRSLGKTTVKPSQEWTPMTLAFDLSKVENPAIDEIRFRPSAGEELWLDDLLLYTPSR
jgi:inosine-uridine nucleoside N-ribohydrolase